MQARREGVWAWILVVRNLNEVRAGGPAPEVTNPPTRDLDRRASEKQRQLQRRIRELPGDV